MWAIDVGDLCHYRRRGLGVTPKFAIVGLWSRGPSRGLRLPWTRRLKPAAETMWRAQICALDDVNGSVLRKRRPGGLHSSPLSRNLCRPYPARQNPLELKWFLFHGNVFYHFGFNSKIYFLMRDCSLCCLNGRYDFGYLGLLISSMLLLIMFVLCINLLDVCILD